MLNASAKLLINHYESSINIQTQCSSPKETVLNKDEHTLFGVLSMIYCPKCGQKVGEDYYFCPKCGTKIKAGTALVTPEAFEAMRQALITAGEEMRKAFQKAAEEMQKGLAEARKEVQTRKTAKTVTCSNCGATNLQSSKFCQKCGKPLS
jgi:predicted amidophosphoribosyltransferase